MRLFVGGLNYTTQDRDLLAHFDGTSDVNAVDARVILDHATGKSRGYGFVEVTSRLSEDQVIRLFHANKLDGRTLTVNKAKPRPVKA